MSDTPDLHVLAAQDFSAHLDSVFRLPVAGQEDLELTLIEVADSRGESVADARREPFSAVFRGPKDRVFDQQTCRMEHPDLGTLVLFLVPLEPDEAGPRYEAVFS